MTTQPGATASSHTDSQHGGTGTGRRPIAGYHSYSAAERAVDYLSDNGFPVSRVAIIGSDVRLVEQVVGRLNHGGAALRGAGSGALTDLLIGWLFGLEDVVDEEVADEAKQLLAGMPAHEETRKAGR